MADIPPNQTIYVNNLPEKLKKDELKKALHSVFSQFGKILDIVSLKTFRLRGQAWVVFADVSSASSALRQMQGFPFFSKAMRIAYCKGKSDVVAKAEGTFVPRTKDREKRKAEDRAREHKAHQAKKQATAADPNAPKVPAENIVQEHPPHKILFVENLPSATNDRMLTKLFQQFPGFCEVRMVETKPGISFIEYESDTQASVAMSALQGFKITAQNAMRLTYAKK
mmetsp:Transcript_12074/g.14382  ORF Transcript_12074/g.14382 Transcript_12074/m.14382 type:complete len:225 (-) Transcript_12074:450-1124(-)|eukprot:CAMPEP_0197857080 /NCGR_PEP_ID=MMETSP1438-20131217/29829_1 /TAXON_ID=1461541 /ORGANISM="Pterosperma sp., Strain CCMP1384" /LENGTH=224 /DNA_ID=CAMNT_0043472775 /DNA_START=200 /DNA_END=874 /DNA_ORIENTATION=+